MKYVLTVALLSISSIAYSKCDSNNFDQCKTCEQLDKAVVLSEPDKGDYYRGAFWNGLYASYVLNCQGVAKKLLDSGATPSLGGSNYALPVVVSRKWPHENKSINEEWKNLLLKYNVKLDLIPDGEKSPFEVFFNNPSRIEYMDIWAYFVAESNPKPVDLARNVDRCASDDYVEAVKLVLSSCIYDGIDNLDDGISTASDIADGIIHSCEKNLRSMSDAITCKIIVDEKITDFKLQESTFNILKKGTFDNVIKYQREDLITRVLENRNKKRK